MITVAIIRRKIWSKRLIHQMENDTMFLTEPVRFQNVLCVMFSKTQRYIPAKLRGQWSPHIRNKQNKHCFSHLCDLALIVNCTQSTIIARLLSTPPGKSLLYKSTMCNIVNKRNCPSSSAWWYNNYRILQCSIAKTLKIWNPGLTRSFANAASANIVACSLNPQLCTIIGRSHGKSGTHGSPPHNSDKGAGASSSAPRFRTIKRKHLRKTSPKDLRPRRLRRFGSTGRPALTTRWKAVSQTCTDANSLAVTSPAKLPSTPYRGLSLKLPAQKHSKRKRALYILLARNHLHCLPEFSAIATRFWPLA